MIASALMYDGRVLEVEDRPPGPDERGLWLMGTLDDAVKYIVEDDPDILRLSWTGDVDPNRYDGMWNVYTVRAHEPEL